MRILRGAAPLLAVVLLVGCGGVARIPRAASPVPSGPVVSQVTEADDGRTVRVAVGTTLEVVLRRPSGFTRWGSVASSDQAVLQATADPRAASTVDVTLAAFSVLKAGRTQITATSLPACTPEGPCSQAARRYQVTVVAG
jgi:hypothetical protein